MKQTCSQLTSRSGLHIPATCNPAAYPATQNPNPPPKPATHTQLHFAHQRSSESFKISRITNNRKTQASRYDTREKPP